MLKSTGVHIRIARKSDAEVLARLAGELGYPASSREIAQRLLKLSASSQHTVFVAHKRSVVGWIQVSLIHSLESGSFAEIAGLVVAGSRQNTGIGSRLVAAAEHWASSRGVERIRVRTNVIRQQARSFYRNRGYKLTKTQEVFDKLLPSSSKDIRRQ